MQMSIIDNLGLLPELMTLDPLPFKSETFAHWYYQVTITLLARDFKVPDPTWYSTPKIFLAFTPLVPGIEDLPCLDHGFLELASCLVAPGQPKVITVDREEVNVVVAIYEMVHGVV